MNFRKLKIIEHNWENIFCSFILFLFFLISSNSFAADSLSYSGRLVKADGAPVAGPVDLTVDLAYTSAPGTILCSQNFSSVALSNGVFHLKLDLVCPGPPAKTLTEILTAVPATFAAALRVSDVTNNKIYAFQALHAMPFANLAETSKQLVQLGAANGQVLKWNDTTKKWEPGTPGGGGTVTNVTVTSPLAVVNGATIPALSMTQATGTVDGYLSSTDWNTFNNKIGVATGGTTLQFYRGDNSWQTLNTSVVPESGVTNLYFSNARVLGVPLDGFVAGPGVIVATDTVLQAFSKTQGQINLINTNSSGYVTKMGTSTMVAAGTIDAQLGFVLVGAPGSINDATPRGYVNDQDALKISKAGDTMSGVLTLDSDLKIKSGTTANYVTIKGHATSDNYNLFLPQTDGNAGEVLQTDGVGNLVWVNPNTLAAGTGTVNSSSITDDSIMNVDINSAAAIDQSKIAGLTAALAAKEPTLAAGTAAQYYAGDKTWQTLNTSVVPELTNLYFTEPRVRNALLTGVNTVLAGTIAGTDSVLDGFGKAQKQLTDIASGVTANQWTAATGNVYRASGSVGIGIANPQSKLDVYATGLAGTTLPVVNIAANSFDNLGSDPTLLNLSTPTGGTPRGNIFKAANSNSSFTISNNPGVNSSSAFTTISSGGYTKFVPGYSGEKAMMAIGVNSSNWFDGATPVVGSAVNLNITAWGGSTPSYRDVYGVPVKIMASNPSATSTAFYADVTGAQNNWAFYAANGNSYFAENVGIGTTIPTATLHLKAGAAAVNKAPLKLTSGVNLTTPEAGAIEYDGTNLYYTDNTNTRKTLGVTGAGITTLGGLSGTSQTFATGTAGTAPAFSSATTIHTLNIPMAATAAVTAGLISKAEYDAFSAKQAAFTTSAALLGILTDETGSGSAVFSASPTFTGVPLAPTAAVDTNTTQIATTAFVLGQASSVAPLMNGVAAVGTSLRYTRQDHIHPTDTSRAPAAGSTSITTLGTVTTGTWNGAVVGVPYGGTGKATLGLNKLLFGNDTAAVNELALPVLTTTSVLLSSITTGAPAWTTSTTGNVLKGSLTGVAFGPLAASDLPAGTLSGSGTAGYIPYYSAATTLANSPMTVSGSNIGIGTTTPLQKFVVQGGNLALNAISNASPQYEWRASDNSLRAYISHATETVGATTDENRFYQAYGYKTFYTQNAERMRIDSNGNVGIGTTVPTEKMELYLPNSVANDNVSLYAKVTNLETTSVKSGFFAHANAGLGYLRVHNNSSDPRIEIVAEDNSTYQPDITFFTNASERMRIDNITGNIGIGTTTPATKLEIKSSAINTNVFNLINSANSNSLFKVIENSSGNGSLFVQDSTGAYSAYFGADANMPWIGTNTNHDFRVVTNSTEKMRIMANGNVGIGTSTPNSVLTVDGGAGVLSLKPGPTIDHAYLQLFARSASPTVRSAYIGYPGAGSTLLNISNEISGGHIGLLTSGAGNVGVGTSAPAVKLDVLGAAKVGSGTTARGGDYLSLTTSSGVTKRSGIQFYQNATGLFELGIDPVSNNANTFFIHDSINNATRFTIAPTGNVGIGTTNPLAKLHVAGGAIRTDNSYGDCVGGWNCEIYTWDMSVASIYYTGLTQRSDRRLKTNITDLSEDKIIERMGHLRPVTYEWKNPKFGRGTKFGFIAQDVEKVWPEIVSTATDAQKTKSVDYTQLISPLVKTVQKIFREIASIRLSDSEKEERIKTLEAENVAKTHEISTLKSYLCAKDPAADFCPKKNKIKSK